MRVRVRVRARVRVRVRVGVAVGIRSGLGWKSRGAQLQHKACIYSFDQARPGLG